MRKYIGKIITAAVILVILAAVAFYAYRTIKERNRTYDSYEIVSEAEIKSGAGVKVIVGDNSIIRYTRDGISAYNASGREIWNVSYEMSDPIVDICGDYAAVADKGTVNFYILDSKGNVHKYEADRKIENLSVGGKGVTAIWMDDGLKDYISVYDIDGKKAVDMMTTTAENGIPVALDMSPDGTKLVTSYVVYQDNVIKNQITFYNFGDKGANFVDRLVGLKTYTDRLVSVLRFAGNESVAAFSDKGVDLFSMDVTEEDAGTIAPEGTIEQMSVDKSHVGLVLKDAQGKYSCHVYNLKGKEVDKKELDGRYRHFLLRGEDIVFSGGTDLYITRIGRKDKIKTELPMEINGVFPADGKLGYTIVGENKLTKIELRASKK